MIEVAAQGIRKVYGTVPAVDGVDLTCSSGGLNVILGPNGSGKSTLLRLLSLVEAPEAGRVLYRAAGKIHKAVPAWRRQVVLVPDRRGVFNATVLKNVLFGPTVRRWKRAERAAAAEEALRRVGLWEQRRMNALNLSNGEAQRLCLAMALAVSPTVILLDEPTASLDPINAAQVEEIIHALRSSERLVVLVTHNLFQARRLADRVVFLRHGRVLEDAPAAAFFAAPATETARRFISGELVY